MNDFVSWWEIGVSSRRGVSNARRATWLRNSNAVRKADCCVSGVPSFRMWSADRGIMSFLIVERGFVRLEKRSRTRIRLIETL